ncbi:MAG TPA: glycosyl hydrolase family 28 protein [Kofleriaceae bacterium]|nr:glycosyl hydrolase family 28 protein [Kofleriaceae bacterium]
MIGREPGSVVLSGGTFLSGTITLKSTMTFFIDPSATLLGSAVAADYPAQAPATGNTQLSNTQRALLYAPNTTHLKIDGGGAIDGQGDSFGGAEATRPLVIWSVLSNNLTVQNLYLKKGAVWSLVSMETDHVLISNINLESDGITHDGIDIVDGTDVTVQNVAVNSGDDAMCLKTGVRRGIDTLTVKDSVFSGSGPEAGSNGIKFGTATYGALKNITIQDSYVKNVQYAAMAVESRQGADIAAVGFHRIEFAKTGAAVFVYLAQDGTTHPVGDVPKLGSITGVSFTDITGSTFAWGHSPHQGSLITGQIYTGTTYPITNLAFTNVAVTFDGGLASVPGAPPEATPGQYPESNMFGDLPAWGYYLRHVTGVTFTNVTSSVAATDARQKLVTSDVAGVTGAP